MIWNLLSFTFGLLLFLLLALAICVSIGLLIVFIIGIFKGLKNGPENNN